MVLLQIDIDITTSEEVDLPKAEERFRLAEAEYRAVEYLQDDERKVSVPALDNRSVL